METMDHKNLDRDVPYFARRARYVSNNKATHYFTMKFANLHFHFVFTTIHFISTRFVTSIATRYIMNQIVEKSR